MENNKPQVRFKGFDEDWEERDFSQIINLQSGRDYKHLSDGNIPVYGTGGYMTSVNKALSYNEDSIGIGRKGTIDKPFILRSPFWTVDTLFYAVPKSNNDLEFLYCIFQKVNWKKKDESTGVPSLSKTTINSVLTNIPNKTEQNQIGTFFENLDKLITEHQQKHSKLKALKKAMLAKMFPQQGQTVPEIRFKGFSGDWETKELSILFDIIDGDRGKDYPGESDFFESGQTLFLDTGNVKKNGFNFSTKKFITKEKDENLGSGKLKLYDFILTSRGTLGNLAFYDDEISFKYPIVRINSAMLILRPVQPKKVSNKYLLSVLRGGTIDSFMSKNKAGSAQPHITKRDISKHRIVMPIELEEQIIIGNYFQNIDHLITNHDTQITKLQNIKKAFLAKMFI